MCLVKEGEEKSGPMSDKNLQEYFSTHCSCYILSFLRLQGSPVSSGTFQCHNCHVPKRNKLVKIRTCSCYWDNIAAVLHYVWVWVSKEKFTWEKRKTFSENYSATGSCAWSGIRANFPEWPKHLNKHLALWAVTDIKTAPGGMVQLDVIFPGRRGFLRWGFLRCGFVH